jgi:glycosyltransferase involved in cell wall biosynthesis
MDIVCVSHLRWNFVYQRPQHLLTRAARDGRVLYVEEPIDVDGDPRIDIERDGSGVYVAVPRTPASLDPPAQRAALARLISDAIARCEIRDYVLWYYTPMALPFTHHLHAGAVVYDCMDELSAFAGAPKELTDLEDDLFRKAQLVFTGGQRLYEAKRARHSNVHAFPSSVDIEHFARARRAQTEPGDQASIRGVRLGFFGVIDERMDYDLLREVSAQRPAWQIILIGPTAKIDPASLPRAANIHYLGPKSYAVLPDYLAGWDVALLPFARNEATRYISPTKTPEYLAAGKPVVSTSIHDVVRPYGQQGLARIADTPSDFIAAVEDALGEDAAERTRAADAFLSHMSWDGTWTRMRQLIQHTLDNRDTASATRAVMRRRFAIGGN